jgi:hypothetical protein
VLIGASREHLDILKPNRLIARSNAARVSALEVSDEHASIETETTSNERGRVNESACSVSSTVVRSPRTFVAG